MTSKVFISYSRLDLDVVREISRKIERGTGIRPWVDLSGIETGSQFQDVIIRAIEACHVVLFVLSKNSMQSEWARKEVLYARGKGKRIYPVIVDGSTLDGWFLFEFGIVDCIDYRNEVQADKLIRDLAALDAGGPSDSEGGVAGSRRDMTDVRSEARERERDSLCVVMPTRDDVERVTEQFAHYLYQNGWDEFSVMEFNSSRESIEAFVVRDAQNRLRQMVWLKSTDILRLSGLSGHGFTVAAAEIVSSPVIDEGMDVDAAWNFFHKAFMPVFLFAYDIRGLIYDAQRRNILIPFERADVSNVSGESVCIREYDGRDCACLRLDAEKLSQLVGKSRVVCSQLVLKWVGDSGIAQSSG